MFRRAAILFVLALLNSGALAQLAPPRLASISPPAGQVGTSFNATFSGNNLDDATQVRFSHSGISAKALGGNGLEAKFAVTIAPDVPSGSYDARVVGKNGITNVRSIWVGSEKQLASPTDNTSVEKAMPLAVNSATWARCAAATMQFYAVDLTRDQHVIFECETEAIDSRMSSVMLLSDQNHRELAHSRLGGILDFTAPSDGRYFLCIHDLLYRGGTEYPYHLAVTTRPHLHSIFPPVGSAGSRSKYTLFGYNLPHGSPSSYCDADGTKLQQQQIELELPTQSLAGPADTFEYRLQSDVGSSNALKIFIVKCQQVGRFSSSQSARLDFTGIKGETQWVEIYADRFGIPAAADLRVQRIDSDRRTQDLKEINGIDSGASYRVPFNGMLTRDVGFVFQLPQDGTYRLTATNMMAAPGIPVAYAISVGPPVPDFDLTASPPTSARNNGRDVQPTGGIVLPRGGRFPIELSVYRSGGFEGEIHVECQGLPEGVTGTATIAEGQSNSLLFLVSDASAKAWAGAVKIVATANTSRGAISHEAHYRTIVWPSTEDEAAPTRSCSDLAFGVSEEPVAMAIETPQTRLKLDATRLHVPFKAVITSPLRIHPGGLPQLLALPEITIAPGKPQQLIDIDLGPQRLTPGRYTIYLEIAGARRSNKNPEQTVYTGPIVFDVPGRR